MVSMVLILMVTVPPLPFSLKSAYSYISKISSLLVHLRWEQRRQKLALVACDYIVCPASQTLICTGYSCVPQKYTKKVRNVSCTPAQHRYICLTYPYCAHENNGSLQSNGTHYFAQKVKLQLLPQKIDLQFFASLLCPHAMFMAFFRHLFTAACNTGSSYDTTF